MKVLWMLLLLCGCAANADNDNASFNPRLNGRYTTFGGAVLSR